MFLRVHMEIALRLLLLMFLPSWLASDWDGSAWSGREQRGLFINAIVCSSEHTKAQKNQRRLKESDLRRSSLNISVLVHKAKHAVFHSHCL